MNINEKTKRIKYKALPPRRRMWRELSRVVIIFPYLWENLSIMSLFDALKSLKSAAPTANPSADPSNAEQLFNQFLQAREEGDDEQALEYVRRAAQGGDIPSMVRLGLHYFQGCGTEADVDQAAHYWEIAARYGAPEAKLKLAELYIMGLGEDQDYDEGLRLLDEAIKELPETPDAEHFINTPDWNLGEALFWKGIIYYYGLGQEQNHHSAMMYFKLAKKGFPVADNVVDDGEDPREALKGYG